MPGAKSIWDKSAPRLLNVRFDIIGRFKIDWNSINNYDWLMNNYDNAHEFCLDLFQIVWSFGNLEVLTLVLSAVSRL